MSKPSERLKVIEEYLRLARRGKLSPAAAVLLIEQTAGGKLEMG